MTEKEHETVRTPEAVVVEALYITVVLPTGKTLPLEYEPETRTGPRGYSGLGISQNATSSVPRDGNTSTFAGHASAEWKQIISEKCKWKGRREIGGE